MLTDFYSLERAVRMETLRREVKKLVTFCGWTYAVIWKIAGPGDRAPVWYLGHFNEQEEREIGQAQQFENIYKSCQFTAVRPGFANVAWHRQSPYWWTRQLMEPVPTDETKELFLTQAKIQTLVCFPGQASADGTGYCVELASTSWIPESEVSKAAIRDFISTSIAPHISGGTTMAPESYPLLQELLGVSSGPSTAALEQDTAILTDIISEAAIHGDQEELGFGNIGRRDIEPYYPWTVPSLHSGNTDHYFPNFDVGTSFGFDGASIPVLQEPTFQNQVPEWLPSTSSTHGLRKGKEILKQTTLTSPVPTSQLQLEYLEKLRKPPTAQELMLTPSGPVSSGSLQTSSPPPRDSPLPTSQLQLEYLEKLRKPPTAQELMLPPTGPVSSGSFQISSPVRNSPWSPFQPHRQLMTRSSKRPSMIYKWVTALAPRMREEHGSPPEALSFDPRSPNTRMLDQQAAVIHKHAERRRRSNMNNKLRTLISIVPTIDKKDKISVLTSTIAYIRQLTSRLSSFENNGEATTSMLATASRTEEDAFVMSMDSTQVASSSRGDPIVVVEESSDGKTWLIKVQANYHSWSLLQILNLFQELGFEVISMDYWTLNGWTHANVSIKHSKKSGTSSSDLKEILCRVLESECKPKDYDDSFPCQVIATTQESSGLL